LNRSALRDSVFNKKCRASRGIEKEKINFSLFISNKDGAVSGRTSLPRNPRPALLRYRVAYGATVKF
jgi:hypothetical protein